MLNFHEHIKILEAKIAQSVVILNKLNFFLPSSALFKLYYSLIHSYFNYVLAVWGSTYLTYLKANFCLIFILFNIVEPYLLYFICDNIAYCVTFVFIVYKSHHYATFTIVAFYFYYFYS